MTVPYRIRLNAIGGPDQLVREAFDPRAPEAGEIRVRQTAIGLNFIDTYHRTGLYPVKLPFTPGSEAAGVIEAVGAGVTPFQVGQRVAYVAAGTYATHWTGPVSGVVALPDDIDDATAAAVLLKGLTAWMLLFEIRPITARDALLVWAPVGGVGTLLTPWAASLGARVIAVTSSAAKADAARALGAAEVIIGYEDVAAKVRALTGGKGVDVALDSVGKISFDQSLASLRPRGWLIGYGNASGAPGPVAPSRLAQGGSLVMTRASLFNFIDTADALARGAAALFGAIRAGTVAPDIGQRYGLGDVADAHRALESGITRGATILVP
jgi:NADPH:quinone reductase